MSKKEKDNNNFKSNEFGILFDGTEIKYQNENIFLMLLGINIYFNLIFLSI